VSSRCSAVQTVGGESHLHRLVGTQQTVLVCGTDDRDRLYGRLPSQAPEIDGVVYLRGNAPVGAIAPARVTRASTYDVHAEIVSSAPVAGVDTATQCLYIPPPL